MSNNGLASLGLLPSWISSLPPLLTFVAGFGGVVGQDVEELICWHEDFDSREYTRSSQRHAATLEHGQREIRSIVGSVLLSQLRTNYHNHLAQVRLRL